MPSGEHNAPVSDVVKRGRPALTVDTSTVPPSPRGGGGGSVKAHVDKPQPSTRSASSSSLLTSSTSAGVSPRSGSPSVLSKRGSPRCFSPACAIAMSSERSSWLGSPKSSALSPRSLLTPPITSELYFRLLKKSDVLDQLLSVNSHLESQLQHVRELEADRARTSSIQELVFQELENYKRKFVESQQYMLEVLEAMTCLTVQEEELQRGTGTEEAKRIASQAKEERVVRDLEAVVSGMRTQSTQIESNDNGSKSVESSALRRVGLQRVEQLSRICVAYESQLKKSEVELSKATHAAYRDECLSKIKQYEAMQQHHHDEIKVLETRIANLTHQTSELQDLIDDQRDELARFRELNDIQQRRHAAQCSALEKFGKELKAELRKRYGVVPNLVDSRWHTFFPHCAAPE